MVLMPTGIAGLKTKKARPDEPKGNLPGRAMVGQAFDWEIKRWPNRENQTSLMLNRPLWREYGTGGPRNTYSRATTGSRDSPSVAAKPSTLCPRGKPFVRLPCK